MNNLNPHKPLKHSKSSRLNQSIRIPLRISNSVTSLSLRKNLIALWILLRDNVHEHNDPILQPLKSKDLLTDFVYNCLDQWEEDTAKGFSDFVSEKLIESILEENDYIEYKKILEAL